MRATSWVGWVVGVGRVAALALVFLARGANVVPGDRAKVVTDPAVGGVGRGGRRRRGVRGRVLGPGVGQHAEDHHGGHHDGDGGGPPGPVVHGIEGVTLRPVGACHGNGFAGAVVADPVAWSGVVEDQGDLGIGELVVAPDRDGGDRAAGADPYRRAGSGGRPSHPGGPRRSSVGTGNAWRRAGPFVVAHHRSRRASRAFGQVLEGPERRVVAAHRVDVVARRTPEHRHGHRPDDDQCHDGQGDPHPDYSTRRTSAAGGEAPAGPPRRRERTRRHPPSVLGDGSIA